MTETSQSEELSRAKAVEFLGRLGYVLVLDVETTGFSPEEGRVVEIALVEFVGAEMGAAYSTPVRGVLEAKKGRLPNAVPAGIIGMAPRFRDIAPTVKDMIEHADFVVAQNGRFDVSWLRAEFGPAGIEVEFPELIDTLDLGRAAFPGLPSYSLDSLAEAARVKVEEPRHRALADVLTEHAVFVACVEKLIEKGEIRSVPEFQGRFAKAVSPRKPKDQDAVPPPIEDGALVDKLGRMVAGHEGAGILVNSAEQAVIDRLDMAKSKVIRGAEYFAKISEYEVWEALSRDDESAGVVREILTQTGIWNAVSEINGFHLAQAIAKGLVPEAVAAKLREFGKLKHVRKLKIFPSK